MQLFIKRLLKFFFLIHKKDPEELRKKKVVNILSIGIALVAIGVILLYSILFFYWSPIVISIDFYSLVSISIIAFIGCIIIFMINNFLSRRLANYLFLTFIFILIFFADSPYELVLGRSLLLFVIPIVMAGFLIKPFASFIVSFLVILAIFVICLIEGLTPNFISLFIYVLVAFFTWFSGMNLEKSIKKYRKAYKRENFYKDLFVHDTNNILQNMLMAVEILDADLKTYEELSDKKYIYLIKTQIGRLANLIKNITIFDTFSKSEYLLKRRDFKKDLEEAIQDIELRIEEKDLDIQIQLLTQNTSVIANKFLVDIIKNILFNSIVYNDNSRVKIAVRISSIQDNGKQFLKAEFIDNGIGIPDSIKKNIFRREIDKNKGISGSGLGLSLVKSILDIYKGKIWVENVIPEDYTKGSNFIILIPKLK
ncbi:MAG: sensor histidine kinase [Candidatus Hermodarchaeota archaeon]